MHNLTVLLFVFVGVSFSKVIPFGIGIEANDNQIWRVPQFDGSYKMMTEQEAEELAIQSEISERLKNKQFSVSRRDKITFFLYTQQNLEEWQEVDMDNPKTLHKSNFNSNHPTRFGSSLNIQQLL